jgi:ABC-2 type transport system permease protein
MVFLTPVVIFFVIWLGPGVLSAAGLTRGTALPFFGSLILGYLLCYYLKVALGLLAFWMTESVGVFNVFFMFQFLFEGSVMPLDLLPGWAQRIGELLPFRYFYFLSMSIFQGKVDAVTAHRELIAQLLWCGGAYLALRVVYRLGVRQYSAVGG